MSTPACRRLLRIAALCGALASVAPIGLAAQAAVTARDAWIRATGAGRSVTAAFLTLENRSDAPRFLVRGTASVGDTLELHEMKREGGMMRMAPVRRIEVPARGEVSLRPGGLHLMLFGLAAPLAEGDTVQMTLTLDDGSTLDVRAAVRTMRGMMP